MTTINCVRFSFTKSLIVLYMALQISGCGFEQSVNLDTTSVNLGTATVTWTAPADRSNGDPLSLSEIGGYKVYYGKTKGNYSNLLDVNNGTAEKASFTEQPGVYFYVMTTYDVDGRESGFSAENEITI